MNRKIRGLWPVVAIVVIIVVLGALVWEVWRSPHRTDLATFWALPVAIIVPVASLIIYLAKKIRKPDDSGRGRALDELADLLAGAVEDQWSRAATERRLLYPEPIPVRWERPSQPIAGPVSAAASSRQFPPLPGLAAVGEGQLRKGGLRDLHAVYGGLGSGRMVIVGAPGSGKTGAAVLLVLAALKYREQVPKEDRPQVPVPVMFTMHGWDPNTERVQDWLAARLHETFPLFAGTRGAADAAELVRAGKVAVILDGLDEIAEELRPVALRALSQQAVFRVVVLARSVEMAVAAQQGHLEGAVALELQDVDPLAAADYLTRVQRDPAPAGWRDLTDRLRNAPHSPIARVLSNPLTLTLVRDTYSERDDVRELLDFCGADGHGVSREDMEDHLLDRVLPAAYSRKPGKPAPPYDLYTARFALTRIAARMNQDRTSDLKWWRLREWAPRAARQIVNGLLTGLLVGIAVGLAGELTWGFWTGFAAGCLTGATEIEGMAPARIGKVQWRIVFSPLSVITGLVFGVVFGLVAGFAAGLAAGLRVGLVVAFGTGLVFGLLLGLMDGLGNTSSVSPPNSQRKDRRYTLITGLVGGLGLGLVGGLSFGLVNGLRAGLVGGLAVGLVFGLIIALCNSESWASSLTFAQLARRWHTPVRLMRFLDDAHGRGVLRTVGPVYQFRHARLQDRLAEQANTATHPERQAVGTQQAAETAL